MFGSMGLPELAIVSLIFGVFGALLPAWAAWLIMSKVGYPAWIGLGAFLWPVALVLALFLAWAEWPIEKRLREGG